MTFLARVEVLTQFQLTRMTQLFLVWDGKYSDSIDEVFSRWSKCDIHSRTDFWLDAPLFLEILGFEIYYIALWTF